MKENIYVKTTSLDRVNFQRAFNDCKEWLNDCKVYLVKNPLKIVVIGVNKCTIINEGDVFSLIQKQVNRKHDIEKHSGNKNPVWVSIRNLNFIIETTVGEEALTFRLTCLDEPDLSGVFNDYDSLRDRLNEFLEESIEELKYL